MTTTYETPGVYIEEETGSGVIQGVSTSVAAFVGPTHRGPVGRPVRITSFDQFLATFGTTDDRGRPFAHLRVDDRTFYTSFAVQGFFQNGGQRAYVVNVSDGEASNLTLLNGGNHPFARVIARQPGTAGDDISVTVQPNTASLPVIQAQAALDPNPATPSPSVDTGQFAFAAQQGHTAVPGDLVVDQNAPAQLIEVVMVEGNWLILNADPGAAQTLVGGDIRPGVDRFRTAIPNPIISGIAVQLADGTNTEFAIVRSVDSSGFIYLAASPPRTSSIAAATATVTAQTFAIQLDQGSITERLEDLSLEPSSPNYLFGGGIAPLAAIEGDILEPASPPLDPLSSSLPVAVNTQNLTGGLDGTPTNLGVAEYRSGLDLLRTVDEVSIVAVPDSGAISNDLIRRQTYQALIGHCLEMADRIALIDPPPDLLPSGASGIEGVRADVQSDRGFASLYYPWLQVLDPWASPPRRARMLAIPPSGHIAGVMARTDSQRGASKAPAGANATIREVLGVQTRLTDRDQAPLNKGGINVLRVLPGSNAVTVWGARTTVDPVVTDWLYVNVRRLMLFIEESIQEGIRWAVFEPNDMGLWKALERVIRAFLREQWRAGALFGAEEDHAFRIRIDESLNPPAVRNLGRLNIELMVAPVRPAEFIVVRIGLFDGGAEVEEV